MSISRLRTPIDVPDAARAAWVTSKDVSRAGADQVLPSNASAAIEFAGMLILNLALVILAWVFWHDGRPFVAGLMASIPLGCIARALFKKGTGI